MKNDELKQYKMNFVGNLKLLVKETTESKDSKVTKEMIAEGIGVKPQTLSNYFRDNDPNLKMETLIGVTRYFHVSFEWLIGISESRNPENESFVNEYGLSSASADILKRLNAGVPQKESTMLNGFNPPVIGKRGKQDLFAMFLTLLPEYEEPVLHDDMKTKDQLDAKLAKDQLAIVDAFIRSGMMELFYGYLNSIPSQTCKFLSSRTDISFTDVDIFWTNAIIKSLESMKADHLREVYDNFEWTDPEGKRRFTTREVDSNGRVIN